MRFLGISQLSLRRLNAVFSAGTVRGTASSAAMRLVQFCHRGGEGGVRVGVEQAEGQGVIDLKAFDPSMPSTMRELLEMGQKGMDCAKRALSSGQHVVARSDIRLLSPVTGPEKVVCVGMNYKDHCLEQNAPIPKEPIIFSKFPSTITGPYDDIILPEESQEVDWEVELAFVIGRKGKHIKEEEALSYVAGFTVANDVSARDWQMKRNGKQWLLGKTFDTFCPLGPALVTTAAFKGTQNRKYKNRRKVRQMSYLRINSSDISAQTDIHNLGIRCLVNGATVQDSNTNQMIFQTEKLIAWVSQFVTLCPGDVFLTGTPPGVGVFRNPPVFLKRGDVVECQIDKIGSIRNTVV
ncbi:fumarylacetoacetate hydrolase domain-containing protein 2A isoform X1 [Labeo rohita]|nr:fumarylacetoacetate hydrolase domain-containing protein 2A isoform X1 [Labeo rohita]XP_050972758.1 fumarylacetoacetate hydrolase domain-containing protein 2A isoform X1 [Labeo rohita]XP_050972759.1 fumarylacetoacetate hydrolase domain-containing protein 2A isoform X1 [Labeo rohita]